MDYATTAELARLFGLVLFLSMFAVVVWWIFRPGTRKTFDAYARIPLNDGQEER